MSKVTGLKGMYKDYFLDYASYVILERAVPKIEDGLKPVQRRILHALKMMDDGRFHKVANVIGQTMQYHPHGDAAIGAALINLGQKNLLFDTQGNWGDSRTGDSAAAPRYIEVRLSPFAKHVAFNAKTTEWQLSYDGRKNEPIALPMKFPLLLAQGVDGIAVGLSTKMLPHNFIELVDASIKHLRREEFILYPDFETGGFVDVADYQDGHRGGKVRVRAKIEIPDRKTLLIKELPYSVTTSQLIDSIVKANDKGKIKIKKVTDNTAKEVELRIDLPSGVSPEVTKDALYAFTSCEVSISPNACVIVDNKPEFLTVSEILRYNTDHTRDLLLWELKIQKAELEEKWHFASLEKIFIENRIYRDIEKAESYQAMLEIILKGLQKYVATPEDFKGKDDERLQLNREITEDDLKRLSEIMIKKISKYNVFEANEKIKAIIDELNQVKKNIKNITDYTIAYYKEILNKFSEGRERKTEIRSFSDIKVRQVVANNVKLYANLQEGFVGTGLKKDEFISECSDIDDIIAFRKDGKFVVTRISDKTFVGKDIMHVAVWRKGDDRTTYHMIYLDSETGRSFAKRFQVQSITRDRDYDLTTGHDKNKVLYFSVQPNGESESVQVVLSPASRARIKVFDYDFAELAIKGRASKGNTITKYPVRKITRSELGSSTIGAMKWWFDDTTGRVNREERGYYLGEFDTGDLILYITRAGEYGTFGVNENLHFDPKKVVYVGAFNPQMVISVMYFEGQKAWSMVKRFQIETSRENQLYSFLTEDSKSELYYATIKSGVSLEINFKKKGEKHTETLDLDEFVDVKGWKAKGNKLGEFRIDSFIATEPEIVEESETENVSSDRSEVSSNPGESNLSDAKPKKEAPDNDKDDSKYKPGDTIELDF